MPLLRRPGRRYAVDRVWSDLMEHRTAASMHGPPWSRIGWDAFLVLFVTNSRPSRPPTNARLTPFSVASAIRCNTCLRLLVLLGSYDCNEKWLAVARRCTACRSTLFSPRLHAKALCAGEAHIDTTRRHGAITAVTPPGR